MAAACNDESPQHMELLSQLDEEDVMLEQQEAAPLPFSRRLGGLARRRRVKLASAGAGILGLVVLVAALLSRQGSVTTSVDQATAEQEVEVKSGHHDHHKRNKTAEKLAWVYRNARKGEDWPSLFCWSHIEEWGGERDLLISQLKAKFGIFACNDFAVISRSKAPIVLGPHPKNSSLMVKTWTNDLPPDRKGNTAAGDTTSSYVNARTFLVAWKTLMKSKVMWSHDWIIKCDPDAVFYPERLRWHVAKYSKPPNGPGPFYLMNCNIDGGRIYGSLEVYSVLAIQEMDKRSYECEAMPLDKWGEDLYMEQCMTHLNGKKNAIRDFSLVGDDRCTTGACNLGDRAAFHPYPNVGSYWGCAHAAR